MVPKNQTESAKMTTIIPIAAERALKMLVSAGLMRVVPVILPKSPSARAKGRACQGGERMAVGES
jgi:hypothetical protein